MPSPPKSVEGEVEGLNPTSTYEFKLMYAHADAAGDGETSESLVCDTLVAGCSGSSDKKKCSIL